MGAPALAQRGSLMAGRPFGMSAGGGRSGRGQFCGEVRCAGGGSKLPPSHAQSSMRALEMLRADADVNRECGASSIDGEIVAWRWLERIVSMGCSRRRRLLLCVGVMACWVARADLIASSRPSAGGACCWEVVSGCGWGNERVARAVVGFLSAMTVIGVCGAVGGKC
ncbi:unnamed protein product [Ostreobium quekettii]|uniref:Uncharacterized protein n=1 Tax=Ostreobium quekettii TaxID=121088 RepID=A0A8S1IQ91_9CHLO|nr:unnamed protein product [Ostreobium quekettii]